jgi:hypothetical protein
MPEKISVKRRVPTMWELVGEKWLGQRGENFFS